MDLIEIDFSKFLQGEIWVKSEIKLKLVHHHPVTLLIRIQKHLDKIDKIASSLRLNVYILLHIVTRNNFIAGHRRGINYNLD